MNNFNRSFAISNQSLKRKFSFEEKTFDFPSLPYVCQRRFAEICDGQTLKTFVNINYSTRKLAKRCHYIQKVEIKNYDCTYFIFCFCKENEFCKGFDVSSVERKMEGIDIIQISTPNGIDDNHFLRQLPLSFLSIEKLCIEVNRISLEELKKITISPLLKLFRIHCGIQEGCTLKEVIDFIKSLSKIKFYTFNLYLLPGTFLLDFDVMFAGLKNLESQKFINIMMHSKDSFISFKVYTDMSLKLPNLL